MKHIKDVQKFLTVLGKNNVESLKKSNNKISQIISDLKNKYHTCLLTDHSNMEFIFVKNSKGLFQFSSKQFLEKGINSVIELIHPEDLPRQPKIFGDFFKIYFSIPVLERKKFTFCNDFRCLGQDKKYRWLLQEIHFIEMTPSGKPKLSVSTYTDITFMKLDSFLNLYIGRYNENGQYNIKTHFSYPLEIKKLNLTTKEMEILRLIAEGYLSKHIADQLNISFHTVNTHRRNMLKKTGTRTSSELVTLAKDYGII